MCYKLSVQPYCPECGDDRIFKPVVTVEHCTRRCEFRGRLRRDLPVLRSESIHERPCTKCTLSRQSKRFSIAGTGVSGSGNAIADEVKARLRRGSFQEFQPGNQFVQTKIDAYTQPLPDLPELGGLAIIREIIPSRGDIVAVNAGAPAELDGVAIIREAVPSRDAIIAVNDGSPAELDDGDDLVVFRGRAKVQAIKAQPTSSSSDDSSDSDEDGGVMLIVPARLIQEIPFRQPRQPPTSIVAQKLGGFVCKDRFGVVIPRKTKPAQQVTTPSPADAEVESSAESVADTDVESNTESIPETDVESVTESAASSGVSSLAWSLETGEFVITTHGMENSSDESSDEEFSDEGTLEDSHARLSEVTNNDEGFAKWRREVAISPAQPATPPSQAQISEVAKSHEGFARFCKEHCVSVAPTRSLSPPSLSSTPSPPRSFSPETSLEWRNIMASTDWRSRSKNPATPLPQPSIVPADLDASKAHGFAHFRSKAVIVKDEGFAKLCKEKSFSAPRKATPAETLKWCTMMKDAHRKNRFAALEPSLVGEEDSSEDEDPEEMRYA